MPCDGMWVTQAQRQAAEQALTELAEDLRTGVRKITRNVLTGQVSISSWAASSAARAGWCEGCALRAIQSRGWATAATEAAGITKKAFVVASHSGHKH